MCVDTIGLCAMVVAKAWYGISTLIKNLRYHLWHTRTRLIQCDV